MLEVPETQNDPEGDLVWWVLGWGPRQQPGTTLEEQKKRLKRGSRTAFSASKVAFYGEWDAREILTFLMATLWGAGLGCRKGDGHRNTKAGSVVRRSVILFLHEGT